MTDIPPPRREETEAATGPAPAGRPAAGGIQPAQPTRSRRRAAAKISLIWAIPVLTLVVALALAWNAYSSRGTVIAVSFADATGITPGETALKFREVTVGRVETVRFTPDLERVVVDIRVVPDIASYIGADASFWVVRPQVTTSGISRLDTVLTGTFIEGDWTAAGAGPPPEIFTGMDRPPLSRSSDKGSWVVLSADNAEGLSEGAPVMFRGLQVGRMENLRLSDTDESVLIDVFIEAPHDQRLNSATVFWDVSGFSVSLGMQGVSVDVNSVASLLQGGASFDTFASGGQPVDPGHVFRIYRDAKSAEAGSPADDEPGQVRLTALMPGDLRGIARGAEVHLGGLTVGKVSDLAVTVPATGPLAGEAVQAVTMALSPARLGLSSEAAPEEVLAWLDDRVAHGMRARAASGGFLGMSLIMELATIPDAPAATIDRSAQPHPLMPTTASDVTDIAGSAQGFLSRMGDLPLEDTLRAIQDTANSITAIAAAEDTRAIPASLRATLDEAAAAAADLRAITAELREAGAAAALSGALDSADGAMQAVREAAADVPALVADLRDLPLASAVESLQKTADAVTAVVDTDEARALPASLRATLDEATQAAREITAIASELRTQEAAAKLASALEEAGRAMESVRIAADEVPDMVDKIEYTADKVESIDYEALGAAVQKLADTGTALVEDLRAMLGTEDAAQLPRNLSETLKAASGLLTELQEGGAVGNLNTTLQAASAAADEARRAMAGLPDLTQRFRALAARAETTIAAYGDRSTFNTEMVAMVREVRRASASFGALARMIERNPRAFILGR